MKKLIIGIVAVVLLCGIGYAAFVFLRSGKEDATLPDGEPAPTNNIPVVIMPPANEQVQAFNQDQFALFGAGLLDTFATSTPEERKSKLNTYLVLGPGERQMVRSGISRSMLTRSEEDRIAFEHKVLEAIMAQSEQSRVKARDIYVEFFADLPDSVVNDPPLATSPIIRAKLESAGLNQATGDLSLALDAATGINLRIENFHVKHGPDLHVYLAKHKDPKSKKELDEGSVDVGPLKGNAGSQNFVIPVNVPLQEMGTLVIYSPVLDTIYAIAKTK